MIHDGERAVQRRAGLTVDDWGSAGVDAAIPPVGADFLGRQHMLLIGAPDHAGAVWTSMLTGPPGFTTAIDSRTVAIRALPTPNDPLARLFDVEHDIGILAIDLDGRKRMRVNGRARRDSDRLVVRTEQVYANCPKYIQTRTVVGGDAAQRGTAMPTTELTAEQRTWIATADTFFVATQAAGLGSDVSHRGGSPGFVTVSGSRRLTWPDYVGNSMYMTLGNLEVDSRCGLLFLDWERGDTLQVTGRARVDWAPQRAAVVPGAQRLVDFDVDRVVHIAGGTGLRWSFGTYFRHNPSPPASAD
jgi:predicted pyridoxine 5'-phosphate oxidase superfamily flavin-nucleotide-binding protein